MRTGGPTGHADTAYRVAAPQFLPRRDVESGLVEVGGNQPLAVVDQDQPSLEMQPWQGQRDPSGGGGPDHRPLRRRQIDAVVGPRGRTVEDPLAAPAAGDAEAFQGPVETVAEMVGVGAAGEPLGLEHDLALDAGQQFGIRRFDG